MKGELKRRKPKYLHNVTMLRKIPNSVQKSAPNAFFFFLSMEYYQSYLSILQIRKVQRKKQGVRYASYKEATKWQWEDRKGCSVSQGTITGPTSEAQHNFLLNSAFLVSAKG